MKMYVKTALYIPFFPFFPDRSHFLCCVKPLYYFQYNTVCQYYIYGTLFNGLRVV